MVGETGSTTFIHVCFLFTEWALWANSVYKSQCPSVCVCVCVSVCMYVPSREVPFKCLFAPIYEGLR